MEKSPQFGQMGQTMEEREREGGVVHGIRKSVQNYNKMIAYAIKRKVGVTLHCSSTTPKYNFKTFHFKDWFKL